MQQEQQQQQEENSHTESCAIRQLPGRAEFEMNSQRTTKLYLGFCMCFSDTLFCPLARAAFAPHQGQSLLTV
jgi:hypothetical protein